MEQTPYNTPRTQNIGPVRTSEPPKQERHKEGWQSALSTIAILILAPVIAVLLTTFVFQSYEVDGPSMEETLQNRDRLIVWKVPRTFSRVTGNAYIPGRGEIIVFNREDVAELGGQKQLIKRVIGLPGERVVVRDGHITIYNQQHPNGFNPDTRGGYGNLSKNTQGNIDVTVPRDEVFVAGDNRPNSLDSRTFGTVQADDIVGNLAIRIFPFNKLKAF
jgi:signal peptidase I